MCLGRGGVANGTGTGEVMFPWHGWQAEIVTGKEEKCRKAFTRK